MKAFATSYAADIVFDANDAVKPASLSNIEQSFTGALINTVLNPFVGGTKVGTGLGATVGSLGVAYAGLAGGKLLERTFNKNLTPYLS